jgi:hypothetical protein
MSKRTRERFQPKLVVRQRKATVARSSSSHTNRYGQAKVSFFTRDAAEASAARRGAGTPSASGTSEVDVPE